MSSAPIPPIPYEGTMSTRPIERSTRVRVRLADRLALTPDEALAAGELVAAHPEVAECRWLLCEGLLVRTRVPDDGG